MLLLRKHTTTRTGLWISCALAVFALNFGVTPDSYAATATSDEAHSIVTSSEHNEQKHIGNGSATEAPVVVLNREVTVFRSSFLGIPAKTRAKRTEQALGEILSGSDSDAITVSNEPQGNMLFVDGQLALILTPSDADALRGETLDSITAEAVSALTEVIAETKESRDHSKQLRGLLYFMLATAIFAFVLWTIRKVRNWLYAHLVRLFQSSAANIQLGGTQLLPEDRANRLVHGAVTTVAWMLSLLLTYEWSSFSLRLFPYTRPWGEELNQYFLGVALKIGSGILHALPNLLIAFVIFLLARMTVRLFSPFFDRLEEGRANWGSIDVDTAKPTRMIFNIGVWLFAIVMAYPYLPGSQSDAFRGMSVLIGLMVSVGGAGLLSQAASGLILMYSRTLRVGEYVRINDHEGTVTELRTFTTQIRTGLGEELAFPNALVLGTVTKNYSRIVQGRGYIVDTTVTIGYDTPWRQVEAMLIEAAARTAGIIPSPAPRVFQTSLSDFYPEYRLVCQAIPSEPSPRAEILSRLHANIQDVFNEYDVQIMSPHYLSDPETAKSVPKDKWFTPPAKADSGKS